MVDVSNDQIIGKQISLTRGAMAGNADTTDNRLLTPRANTTRTAGTRRIGRVSLRERNGELSDLWVCWRCSGERPGRGCMYVCIALSTVFPLASKRRKEVFSGRKLDRGVSYIVSLPSF